MVLIYIPRFAVITNTTRGRRRVRHTDSTKVARPNTNTNNMTARYIRFRNALISTDKITSVIFHEQDLQVEIRLGSEVHRFGCDSELYAEIVDFLTDGSWPFEVTALWTEENSTSH